MLYCRHIIDTHFLETLSKASIGCFWPPYGHSCVVVFMAKTSQQQAKRIGVTIGLVTLSYLFCPLAQGNTIGQLADFSGTSLSVPILMHILTVTFIWLVAQGEPTSSNLSKGICYSLIIPWVVGAVDWEHLTYFSNFRHDLIGTIALLFLCTYLGALTESSILSAAYRSDKDLVNETNRTVNTRTFALLALASLSRFVMSHGYFLLLECAIWFVNGLLSAKLKAETFLLVTEKPLEVTDRVLLTLACLSSTAIWSLFSIACVVLFLNQYLAY